MPVTEASAVTGMPTEQASAVELLIGVTGDVNPADLRKRVTAVLAKADFPVHAGQVVVSWPGVDGMEARNSDSLRLIPYRPATIYEAVPLAQISAAQRGILALAAELKAAVCIMIGADLEALDAGTVQALAVPIMNGQCDLTMPIYALNRYEGLINTAILMPLTRALFSKKVQTPLALDYAVSGRYAEHLAAKESRGFLWPAIVAACKGLQIGQVYLATRHKAPLEGLELTTVLAQTVGELFLEVEHSAAAWQRGRAAQSIQAWGQPAPVNEIPEEIEVPPIVESFQLAARNLDELWQLVLPPVTMLELKHLARSAAEQFRMPDRLWARIVYDFALAHRLRTISRTHLMGALAPLYLGWVASYAGEVEAMTCRQVAQRQEQLARAFEENKPYLVSRWRWPDRFNP